VSTRRYSWGAFLGTGPNGRNLCFCGCGREVVRPRVNWFSAECVHAFKIRNDPGTARAEVFRRDHGVCALCGLDVEAFQARISTLVHRAIGRPHCWIPSLLIWSSNWKVARIRAIITRHRWPNEMDRHWWEADHITPVCEGGGQCGLDNYRTLCIPCHKKETAKLRARLAKKRKPKTIHSTAQTWIDL
jgi:5-methylcytosine-specific restriction protein A